MGTRADFYVNRNDNVGWIGSIAWDGDPYGIDDAVLEATDERTYREAVQAMLEKRSDTTWPEMGWPWPWEDSNTTDYAYAFDAGVVYASRFGSPWWVAAEDEPEDPDAMPGDKPQHPDMTAIQRVDYGDRSGLMIFGPAGEES